MCEGRLNLMMSLCARRRERRDGGSDFSAMRTIPYLRIPHSLNITPFIVVPPQGNATSGAAPRSLMPLTRAISLGRRASRFGRFTFDHPACLY